MDDREKLIELLAEYFTIGDSYAYNLTRTKEAFTVGTMSLDDFVEFDDEVVADIADHLIDNGVTFQQWIPVTKRLPEEKGSYLTARRRDVFVEQWNGVLFSERCHHAQPTHWMPLPPKGE